MDIFYRKLFAHFCVQLFPEVVPTSRKTPCISYNSIENIIYVTSLIFFESNLPPTAHKHGLFCADQQVVGKQSRKALFLVSGSKMWKYEETPAKLTSYHYYLGILMYNSKQTLSHLHTNRM